MANFTKMINQYLIGDKQVTEVSINITIFNLMDEMSSFLACLFCVFDQVERKSHMHKELIIQKFEMPFDQASQAITRRKSDSGEQTSYTTN
jgi:hypothetical protein